MYLPRRVLGGGDPNPVTNAGLSQPGERCTRRRPDGSCRSAGADRQRLDNVDATVVTSYEELRLHDNTTLIRRPVDLCGACARFPPARWNRFADDDHGAGVIGAAHDGRQCDGSSLNFENVLTDLSRPRVLDTTGFLKHREFGLIARNGWTLARSRHTLLRSARAGDLR